MLMNVVILSQMIALCNKSLIFATCFFKHTYKQVACAVSLSHKELGNSLQI